METNMESSAVVSVATVAIVTPNAKVTKLVVLSSVIASLGGILFGYDIGIISAASLQLRGRFHLSCLLQELVVACVVLGAFLGSLFSGSMVDSFGRRRCILATSLLFILGSVLLAASQNLAMLMAGRLLVGFGVALSTAAECTYISEIAPPRWRGMLVSLNELGITVGFLAAYVVGHFFINNQQGWRYMFGLAVFPALVQLVGVIFLPQSPYYLVLRGKPIQAQEVLRKIHPDCDPLAAVADITKAVVQAKCLGLRDLFSKKDNMRGRMAIGIMLSFLQQVTGNSNVLYYAPIIFQQFGYCSDSASTIATIGLGCVKVVTAVVALLCVDRIGRRPLLIWGSLLMAVSITALGSVAVISGLAPSSDLCSDQGILPGIMTTGHYNHSDLINTTADYSGVGHHSVAVAVDPPDCTGSGSAWIRGLSITSLMVFISAYQFSFGIGTWLVLSEIFPTKVRGRSIAVSISVYWAANVILTATFMDSLKTMGIGYTMIMYACVCFLSVFLIYFFIPETKQKTLEEITAELNKGLRCHCACLPRSGAAIDAGSTSASSWSEFSPACRQEALGVKTPNPIYRSIPS